MLAFQLSSDLASALASYRIGKDRATSSGRRAAMAVRQRVSLRNPKNFVSPGGLNFEKHIRLHAQEKLRYFDELAAMTDDQRNMRTVTPGYIEGMTRRWMAVYHGEIAAAQYMGTAAKNVDMHDYYDFIMCCVCQQIDEIGHSEMDRDMLQRAGIPLEALP